MGSPALAIESLLEGSAVKKPSGLLLGLGAKLHRASDLAAPGQTRPLAPCFGIERLLEGGLPRGKLVELVGRRSSGRFSIGLAALASVTSTGEPSALVDLDGHLDPQAAAEAGVDLELLLWVRPRRARQALASAEMLLAAGFPLVVVDLGLFPRGARYLPDAVWLRLARAASAQDSSLLLLTPGRMSGNAADAVLAADATRPLWQGIGRTPRLLAGLSSRLTLQKLARLTPGSTASLSLSLSPVPTFCHPFAPSCHPECSEGSALVRSSNTSQLRASSERSEGSAPALSITNHQSPITNSLLLHPAPLEIRDPRPNTRTRSFSQSPSLPVPQSLSH